MSRPACAFAQFDQGKMYIHMWQWSVEGLYVAGGGNVSLSSVSALPFAFPSHPFLFLSSRLPG